MAWWLVVFLPAFPVVSRACILSYRDLETLGVTCSPRDSCSGNLARTFFSSSCECDRWCRTFDDCCINARSQARRYSPQGISCLPYEARRGAYAIGKCRNSWNGSPVVRRKCETGDDEDPLMSAPFTDPRTNVTYRNHYCAECNYGSLDNLSNWEITVACSSLDYLDSIFFNITQEFIVGNMSRLGNEWGVYHWNRSLNSFAFYPCEISYRLPDHLSRHVRFCRPHLISTCAANWTRKRVKTKCLAYMAVIYIGDQAYRNAHCALCNRISVTHRTCIPGLTSRSKPSMSFAILLDVNQSDGNRVGETNSCPSGKSWDPFAKKCRTLTCALPGYVYRDGKCVAQ